MSSFYSHKRKPKVKEVYINFLKKIRNVFSWTYTKMPDLDSVIFMYPLSVGPDKLLVKQGPRRMHRGLASKIEVEVDKVILISLGKYNIRHGWRT